LIYSRWLSLFIFILLSAVTLEASNKHILLLHSYNKGLQWSDEVSRGVEDALATHKDYQLTTEYMDTLKNEDPAYLSYLYSLFALKLRYQTYDAVIASDAFAVDFVLHNKDELFPNIPVFFCGIEKNNPYVDIKQIVEKKIPVVLKNTDVAANLQFLAKTLPKLKNVYIISDTTNDSMSINPLLIEESKKLEKIGIHITLNTQGDLDKIAKDIANLPQNSAVLLGTLLRNNQGKYIPYYEVSNLIKKSSAPVFALGDTFLSQGVVGGYLLRGYENGKSIAELTLTYLQGKSTKAGMPIIAANEWVFDYEIFNKYNIDSSLLPEKSTVINTPKSFFDKHRKLVDNAFMIFPFILFSLIIAIFYIYQRYQNGKKLMAQRRELETQMQINIQQAKLIEVGEMLSAIVHQWKLPLVELSAVAHKLHHYDIKKKLTSEDIQKFYDIIMQQTIYMGETIDVFRDFIRPSYEAKYFDVDTVIQEVLSLLFYLMKYHRITVDFELPTNQKEFILGYPNELKQVLVNILNNAKDAILEARTNGKNDSGHIQIKTELFKDMIAIVISDDGIGIDKDVQTKIFEPFFTTKPQGDGFGLYMARLIVESKMKGEISIQALKSGAQVDITLPILQEKNQ